MNEAVEAIVVIVGLLSAGALALCAFDWLLIKWDEHTAPGPVRDLRARLEDQKGRR